MPTAPLSHAAVDAATGGMVTPVAQILSLGAYLPDAVLSNADMERMVDTSDTWIVERTGIRERRRAAPGETPSVMGARAAEEALERAGNVVPDAINVTTCSAETRFPSTACLIQQKLGLGGMPAFDINAACSGFIYGLSLADAMIRSRATSTVPAARPLPLAAAMIRSRAASTVPAARLLSLADAMIRSRAAGTVLVVAAEALTTIVDYTDRSTCVLFGDGAAAAVVGTGGGGGGIRALRCAADGADADLIYFGARPEDPGGPHALRMSGRGTFRTAVERITDVAARVCADAGWHPSEVDWFVPHQANARIIEAAAKRLRVSMDRVILNVDRVGNTSAASIPLALHEAAASGRLRPGQKIVSVAFGSGITWAGLAFEWTGSPSR